ncbi:MAG: hypothetical protein GY850_10865 [bacterium]|nr:hypothetical protein [bacterium]
MPHGVVVGSDIEAGHKAESACTSYKLSDCPLEPAAAFDVSTMGARDILEPISKYAQRQRQEPSTSGTPPGKASPIFVPEPQQPEPHVARQAKAGVLIRPPRSWVGKPFHKLAVR